MRYFKKCHIELTPTFYRSVPKQRDCTKKPWCSRSGRCLANSGSDFSNRPDPDGSCPTVYKFCTNFVQQLSTQKLPLNLSYKLKDNVYVLSYANFMHKGKKFNDMPFPDLVSNVRIRNTAKKNQFGKNKSPVIALDQRIFLRWNAWESFLLFLIPSINRISSNFFLLSDKTYCTELFQHTN
jgi:hypothetical protein